MWVHHRGNPPSLHLPPWIGSGLGVDGWILEQGWRRSDKGIGKRSLANAPVTTCNHVNWLRLLVLKCIDRGLCIQWVFWAAFHLFAIHACKVVYTVRQKAFKASYFLRSFFGMPAAPWYFGTLGRSCVLFFPSKELINSLLAGQCVPVFGCMAFGNHVCSLSLYICSENLQIVVYSVPWQGCSVGWDCTWLICLWEGFPF